ncbi:MAG: hypothetical protein E6G56_07540 [Actinobacteria bacterium]|nr:MAG: hypothetical protein E6G56_07540 [Actinomycetota bacterium]
MARIASRKRAAVLLYPLLQIAAMFLPRAVHLSGGVWVGVWIAIWLAIPLVSGAAIGRWSALVLPMLVVYGWMLVEYVNNPNCNPPCGEDEDWGNLPPLYTIVWLGPLLIAMATGIAGGKLWRRHQQTRSSSPTSLPSTR